MSWSGLASNQTVSFNNLQDAVYNGDFSQKAAIPASNEQITKADANAYVYLDTSYAPYANKASNQLVVKSNLVSGIYAPYAYTMYYQGCWSGCIDPQAMLQTDKGMIWAKDLQVGDMLDSDLGLGMVSYIEYKTQNKFLVSTSERVIPVSDTHQFIDENGDVVTTEELKIGTLVNTVDGIEEITSIVPVGEGPVIDITVEGTHHYYANGFLSHNKACFSIYGWTTADGACTYWGSQYITVYSPDSTLTTSSKLYGTTSGGATYYSFESSYPYVYLSSGQWAQINKDSTSGRYDIINIGTCASPTYVTIDYYVPYNAGCYNYFTFGAYSQGTYLDVTVVVEISWYGDLGGYMFSAVTLSASTTCNTGSAYSGGGINCWGENVSYTSVVLNPSSSTYQIYQVGSQYNIGYCPC